MSYELKIKAKSLAAEAKIIKAEIAKTAKYLSKRQRRQQASDQLASKIDSLADHNINIVRPHARATNIARAFINRKKLSDVDSGNWDDHYNRNIPSWTISMIYKYDRHKSEDGRIVSTFDTKEEAEQAFSAWCKE